MTGLQAPVAVPVSPPKGFILSIFLFLLSALVFSTRCPGSNVGPLLFLLLCTYSSSTDFVPIFNLVFCNVQRDFLPGIAPSTLKDHTFGLPPSLSCSSYCTRSLSSTLAEPSQEHAIVTSKWDFIENLQARISSLAMPQGIPPLAHFLRSFSPKSILSSSITLSAISHQLTSFVGAS
jgi:hypothetical protein